MRAGRELLEREGLGRLTMRDVARGAGVSPGTVYTYFADRESLFAALYVERLERFEAAVSAAAPDAGSAPAFLQVVADEYLDMYRVFGRELNVWALPADTTGDEAAQLIAVARRVFAIVESELLQLAPLRLDAEARRLAMPMAWALLSGLADQFSGQRHVLHEQAWDELVGFAARVLLAGLGQIAEQETT